MNELLLQHAVEQFYYREAALLDDRDVEGWMKLLSRQVRYVVPLRATRHRRVGVEGELSAAGRGAWLDEDITSLHLRLRKLQSGSGWSEDPPSRTRRLITNVRVACAADTDVLEVRSAFLVYRNRADTEVDLFAGERRDKLLPRGGDDFEIVQRIVVLDQSVLLTGHLGILF